MMKAKDMKKLIATIALLVAFASSVAAQTINNLGAGSAVSGTDMFPSYQGSNPAKRVTAAQINTYIQSVWGTGVATFLATPSSANLAAAVTGETGTGALVFATSPTLVTPALGTPASGTLTNTTGFPVANLAGAGTGVLTALGVNVGSAGAPVLFNGALGTPSSGTLTNATGLPVSTGITGLGSGVATFLATPSSANLAAAVTGETGTGALVFGTSPTISTGLTLGFITGSTQCLNVDSSGAVTGTGSACGGSGSTGANPTATAGDVAVNGVATTFMRSDGAPAIQKGSSSVFGIVQVDNTTITASSGVISAAAPTATVSLQTGSNYAIVSGNRAQIVALSNASPQVPTLPASPLPSGWYATACNIGSGTQTITPASGTIGGASTFVLPAASAARPACVGISSDGTNYYVVPDFPMDASMFSTGVVAAARGGAGTVNGALKANGSGTVSQAACTDLSDDGALCSVVAGTGVATAAAVATGAAGGFPVIIATGTSALGTSSISSGACATAVTTTATGTATTDVISWTPNADISAVTGYAPVTTGGLIIYPYPTSNNVNWKVCNPTSSSITPGAVTLNWRVVR